MSIVRLWQLLKGLGLCFYTGVGTPEATVVAKIGAIYINKSGGAATTLYVKTAGDGLATGWTAK